MVEEGATSVVWKWFSYKRSDVQQTVTTKGAKSLISLPQADASS